jgi:catechol 2,3-dioxygenase-like lactoylglutathione lyase family enzyme
LASHDDISDHAISGREQMSLREGQMDITESGTLDHTCFVVHDVEKTAAALAASGIGPWGIWTIAPAASTVRGRDVAFSFRIAFAQVGDSNYELLAPHEGESIYDEHLAASGEGFHHTCIRYTSREAMRAAKAELQRQGRTIAQSADMGESAEFCYFEIPEIGSLIELLYIAELPPPETTVG